MVTKRYEIIFEEKDGILETSTINSGFSAVELVGLLETKKQDVLDQLMNDSEFSRTAKNPDGTTVEIKRKRDRNEY